MPKKYTTYSWTEANLNDPENYSYSINNTHYSLINSRFHYEFN